MKTPFQRINKVYPLANKVRQRSKIGDKIKANYTSTLAQCSKCAKLLEVLSHKGLIKNRNDARFWGLPEKEIFCGSCLAKRKPEMPTRKRYLWNEYQKRGYWEKEDE